MSCTKTIILKYYDDRNFEAEQENDRTNQTISRANSGSDLIFDSSPKVKTLQRASSFSITESAPDISLPRSHSFDGAVRAMDAADRAEKAAKQVAAAIAASTSERVRTRPASPSTSSPQQPSASSAPFSVLHKEQTRLTESALLRHTAQSRTYPMWDRFAPEAAAAAAASNPGPPAWTGGGPPQGSSRRPRP